MEGNSQFQIVFEWCDFVIRIGNIQGGIRYRYGFNGKENDNEIKGEGNQQDYGMRVYDPRLGRFLSVDPLTRSYPELTPYQFASNRPIGAIDLDGGESKGLYRELQPVREQRKREREMGIVHPESNGEKMIRYGVTGGLSLVVVGPAVVYAMSVAPAVAATSSSAVIAGAGVLANPRNQHMIQEAGSFILGLLNPGPEDLSPGSGSDELAKVIRNTAGKVPRIASNIFSRRRDLAKSFGIHMNAVDFSKAVYTKTLEAGTELIQWRKAGDASPTGSYYTLPGVDPKTLGIDASEYTEAFRITLTESVEVLHSTSIKIEDWTGSGKVFEGGGLQIFSKEIKSKSTYQRVNGDNK